MMNQIRRYFSLPLSGFLLAAIFGGITIYAEFVRDDRPAIQFDVLGNSSVLDVREEVSDLKIIHAGADLRKSGQSLRVMVVRISNVGGDDILKSYFDTEAPLGFSVANGELISTELQDTSESYLDDRVTLHVKDTSQVLFSPVILSPNSFFSVRVLIKHSESKLPVLTPVGRVARVSSISFIQAPPSQVSSFWQQTFGGSIWSQVIRISTYPILLVLCLFSLAAPLIFASEKLEKFRRSKKVRTFKKNSGHDFRPEDEVLFKKYILHGSYFIKELNNLMSGEVDLNEIEKKMHEENDIFSSSDSRRQREQTIVRYELNTEGALHMHSLEIRNLFKQGIIERNNEQYMFNSRFEEVFRDFQRYVRLVGE